MKTTHPVIFQKGKSVTFLDQGQWWKFVAGIDYIKSERIGVYVCVCQRHIDRQRESGDYKQSK